MINKAILISSYLKAKRFNRFKNRKDLLLWQEKKIVDFLHTIVTKSKFYKDYYKDHDLNDWRKLPTINKKIMMDNFNDLNTVSINKDDAFKIALTAEKTRNFTPCLKSNTIGLSSGTSGNRGLFVVSDYEKSKWAGSILAKTMPKSLFSRENIAFFLRASSNLYNSVKSNFIKFTFFDLLNDIESHIYNLNQLQPTIVVAPASVLNYFAQQLALNKLRIRPKKIISVAEVLEDLDRKNIEKILNKRCIKFINVLKVF